MCAWSSPSAHFEIQSEFLTLSHPCECHRPALSSNLCLGRKTAWARLLAPLTFSHTAESTSACCLPATLQDLIHISSTLTFVIL